MKVRRASKADIEQVVALGVQMHAEGAYAFLPFDPERARAFVAESIEEEEQCLWVAEEAGAVVGMLAGSVSEYYFCSELVACDLVFYVERRHRRGSAAVRLIGAFREWAREQGARELALATSLGVPGDRAGQFYERLGFTRVGGVYKQRLD